MIISASIRNEYHHNEITVSTNGVARELRIPSKATGFGSAINGGELLFVALATCFCNDVYREAAKRKLTIKSVGVQVEGSFGAEGEPAKSITYVVDVHAPEHSKEEINDLINHVDEIAEIHNTLRQGINVLRKET